MVFEDETNNFMVAAEASRETNKTSKTRPRLEPRSTRSTLLWLRLTASKLYTAHTTVFEDTGNIWHIQVVANSHIKTSKTASFYLSPFYLYILSLSAFTSLSFYVSSLSSSSFYTLVLFGKPSSLKTCSTSSRSSAVIIWHYLANFRIRE